MTDGPVGNMDSFAPRARQLVAGSLLLLGVLHLMFGEELARMMPAWPAGLAGRPYWAHAAGALIAVCGALMFARGRARGGALALAALLVLPVLGLHLPRALPTGTFGGAWLGVLKWLAMATVPLVAVGQVPPRQDLPWRDRIIGAGVAFAPWAMGVFMIGSGILHVRHAAFVADLMQPWMPWRPFWTYFTAVALATGGLGLMIPRTRRLAALLTSLMIFLFFLLVHIPRMLVDPTGPVGWSEMGESLAFAAMSFLMAVGVRGGTGAVPPHREVSESRTLLHG